MNRVLLLEYRNYIDKFYLGQTFNFFSDEIFIFKTNINSFNNFCRKNKSEGVPNIVKCFCCMHIFTNIDRNYRIKFRF